MIRVLLVDDEEHALDMLEILLREIGNVIVAGKYTNPKQAIEEIGLKKADAVFLDIDMPGMKGMEAARAIKTIKPNMQIIFTTAHADYAIEAFEIRSLDYLLKPVKIERLRNSVMRIQEAVSVHVDSSCAQTQILCMGSFSVHKGDSDNGQLSWRTSKEKELFSFLVDRWGQAADQSVIIEALWPESNLDKARSYLYTCISLLRKKIRASGLSIAINKTGNGYFLHIGQAFCDVIELEQLLDRTLEGDGLGAKRLERINALYKGDYLGDCDFAWASAKREQLSAKYAQALRVLYLHFKKNGHVSCATECLSTILTILPDSEKDGRELIKLHFEAGNRNEAIKVYKQLERAVCERLDVELEEETVSLYHRLISSVSFIRRSL